SDRSWCHSHHPTATDHTATHYLIADAEFAAATTCLARASDPENTGLGLAVEACRNGSCESDRFGGHRSRIPDQFRRRFIRSPTGQTTLCFEWNQRVDLIA